MKCHCILLSLDFRKLPEKTFSTVEGSERYNLRRRGCGENDTRLDIVDLFLRHRSFCKRPAVNVSSIIYTNFSFQYQMYSLFNSYLYATKSIAGAMMWNCMSFAKYQAQPKHCREKHRQLWPQFHWTHTKNLQRKTSYIHLEYSKNCSSGHNSSGHI